MTERAAGRPGPRWEGGPLLSRAFFDRPVLEVARDLLGCVVARRTPEGLVAVRLTEVEAYEGHLDPGSHAFRGRTPRNAVMFGPPGHVYVYFTYGMHWCMNLVCGPHGRASAVLLRAGEVVAGDHLARTRRAARHRRSRGSTLLPDAVPYRDLARGPARLTTALGVEGDLDGADACSGAGPLTVHTGVPTDPSLIRQSARTGVSGEGSAHPWRFYADGDRTVSPYRPAVTRRRRVRDSGA